jgi:uncharacterized protein YjeT (DUF2065 family)
VIRSDGKEIGIVQAFRRRLPLGLTLVRIVRGPLWLGAPPEGDDLVAALRAVRGSFLRRRGQFLFWLPELPDSTASAQALRAAGLRRMVTGYCSAWMELGPDEETLRKGLRGNWRNQLGRAERAGLRVERLARGRLAEAALDRYEAFRRDRRFVGPSAALLRAIADAGRAGDETLAFAAFQRNDPVAAIFVMRHGQAAT